MATYSQAFERKPVVPLDTREALIHEVQHGLAKRPRSLAPWILYDGRGSRLYCARWNNTDSRIEMHLESMREQDVSITAAQLDLHFVKGETIHTENSYKFTDESLRTLIRESGFEISETWKAERDHYAVVLARPAAVACEWRAIAGSWGTSLHQRRGGESTAWRMHENIS